ncbi:MAG: SDR family NAD(P)-dependent oxidoreductase [Candidatus Izemoplasmatales bacterium]|jgi:NAD(P)-dependent dehydrogenase (short-subunit alcohol dehydrogenase family)|nr:SDR family NAD(P)-dependent oxidoreductase [bacterium]MDZ4197289.1 SDR family NAD(P)-dependent oxidoreductase [Candidatus Izemoplasmatales bacterium]
MKKMILITGATNGIGLAVLKELLSRHYHVLAVGSNPTKSARIEQELKSQYPLATLRMFSADLSSQDAILELVREVKAYILSHSLTKIDVLINNAGSVMDHFEKTVDGIEYQFALNHLSTILLSQSLLEYLRGGMILFTGSKSHYKAKIHWNNLEMKGIYRIFGAYRQSKLGNLLTAVKFNQLYKDKEIVSYVVDPGLVQTNIGTKNMKGIARFVWNIVKKKGTTPEVAAKTYITLIEHRPPGLYFLDSVSTHYNPIADNQEVVDRFYELSIQKIKQKNVIKDSQ